MKRFLLILFFLALGSTFFAGNVYAVDPVPPKTKCNPDQQEDPNFNSSRPYQASPCGDSPKALMCGNSLQVIEDTPSRQAPLGTEFLDVNIEMPEKTYAAKLSGATFPIAGNTELTTNSQTTTDQIDDATKMNEYLNWYLNGTSQRAEYGQDNSQKLVNFSGPVKKLLPAIIQDSQRITTINNLYTSQTYVSEENPTVNPGDPQPSPTTDKAITHNQIVVCATRQTVPGPIGWLTGMINKAVPHDCYQTDGKPSVQSTYRLNDWHVGTLGLVRTITNTLKDILKFIPGVDNNILSDTFLNNAWNKKTPPLPWADDKGQPFKSAQAYQKAYNEWRGQTCIIVPIIDRLICFNNPAAASPEWSDLYQYVPLSNTVDKNAKNMITGVGINGLSGTEVSLNPNKAYEIIHEPVLYFPHTAEVSELSDSLNNTYVPKEGTTDVPPANTTDPLNDPVTGKCRLIELRSNPGDYLFPEVDPSEVNVDVKPYTVTRIPCHDVNDGNAKRTASNTTGGELGQGKPHAVCQGHVAIEIRMITKVPYADEIYNSTTAGADSTFRKIYPKVGPGAPVSCVSNIPSVTDVQYTSAENMDNMKVIGPLGDNTTDSPKLYFPHFGSVYDYFLKGIQTALRPQGYGEATPQSGTLCKTVTPKECQTNIPDSAVPSKYIGSIKSNFIDLANRWTTDCPGPENNMATQCYNYVVTEAQKAGVNPAFALTIWLNESGASNYCHGGATTQDFGQNISSAYQNIGKQLEGFLAMAKQKLCGGVAGFREPMHAWLSRYKAVDINDLCDPLYQCGTAYAYGGQCNEGGQILNMDIGIIGVWEAVTGGCTNNGRFGITWPTDMGCP